MGGLDKDYLFLVNWFKIFVKVQLRHKFQGWQRIKGKNARIPLCFDTYLEHHLKL